VNRLVSQTNEHMNHIKKRITALFLVASITLAFLFGAAPRSNAHSVDTYYSYYQFYLGYYYGSGNTTYYYGWALPYYYYYLAAYYADTYGYNYDGNGSKSDKHLSSSYYSSATYADYYYNLYAYYGDYYWRTY